MIISILLYSTLAYLMFFYSISSQGGYVSCRNGIWRVQDSLAVSRAIGDVNLKEWVISEPETSQLQLTPDCEFLIMASDGLWDKVHKMLPH